MPLQLFTCFRQGS